MKKLILSLTVSAFAVAAYGGEGQACSSKIKAAGDGRPAAVACGEKAKAECSAVAKAQCASKTKVANAGKSACCPKGKVTKQALLSPKAAAAQ